MVKDKKEWEELRKKLKNLHPIRRLDRLRKLETKDKLINKEIKKEIEDTVIEITNQKLWKRIGEIETTTKKGRTDSTKETAQTLETTVREAVAEEGIETLKKPEPEIEYKAPTETLLYKAPVSSRIETTVESFYTSPRGERDEQALGAYESHTEKQAMGTTTIPTRTDERLSVGIRRVADPRQLSEDIKKYESRAEEETEHQYKKAKKGYGR